MIAPLIRSKRLILRQLQENDDLSHYLDWMTRPNDFPYITTANTNYTLSQLKTYLSNISQSTNAVQFGIFFQALNQHIGNIKFHNIDKSSRSTFVGFLISDRGWQGQGIAVEAFRVASKWLQNKYEIDEFRLGVDRNNQNAIKAYSKAGFVLTESRFLSKEGIQMIFKHTPPSVKI